MFIYTRIFLHLYEKLLHNFIHKYELKMTEFTEIIKKDANIQNENSQTIDKYNKE